MILPVTRGTTALEEQQVEQNTIPQIRQWWRRNTGLNLLANKRENRHGKSTNNQVWHTSKGRARKRLLRYLASMDNPMCKKIKIHLVEEQSNLVEAERRWCSSARLCSWRCRTSMSAREEEKKRLVKPLRITRIILRNKIAWVDGEIRIVCMRVCFYFLNASTPKRFILKHKNTN